MPLKTDAKFALDLATRLKDALDDLLREEQSLGEKIAKLPPDEQDRAWRKLAAQRHHVRFLAAALGDFVPPVGLPLLAEIIAHDKSTDLKGNTLRRRQAMWSLGNLGENLKTFAKLPPDKQKEIVDQLLAEGQGKDDRRAAWAKTGLYYLDKNKLPALSARDAPRVDEVLARAAKSEDRYLREQVAVVLNFWDGPLAVSTLQELARDNGWGTLVRIPEQE